MDERKNTSWNWEIVKNSEWDNVSPDMFYPLARWQKLNFKKILDLGSGKGRHTLFFAENYFDCFACDLSDSGLNFLNEKLKVKKLKANLKKLDMKDLRLNYEENYFDCLISYRVINHTNTKGFLEIVDSIIDILKPNGEAYIVVDAFNEVFLKNNKNYEFTEKLSAIRKGGLEDGIIHHFAIPEEFLENKKIEVIEIKQVLDYKIDPKIFNPYKLHILFRKK